MTPQQLETIADDTRCRPCGYNLRGLSPWGKCPECGGDVRDTLRRIREGATKKRRIGDIDSQTLREWIEGLSCVPAWFAVDAITAITGVCHHHLDLFPAVLLAMLLVDLMRAQRHRI